MLFGVVRPRQGIPPMADRPPPAPAVAMPEDGGASMASTLYERLGGGRKIAAIVNDVVDLHLRNPLIKARFSHLDAAGIELTKRRAAELLCAGSGGPETYRGRDMLTTRRGMNISEQELIAVIDDVLEAMAQHGVDQQERNEVVAILYSMKGEIVRV
jgi:hemoglobin